MSGPDHGGPKRQLYRGSRSLLLRRWTRSGRAAGGASTGMSWRGWLAPDLQLYDRSCWLSRAMRPSEVSAASSPLGRAIHPSVAKRPSAAVAPPVPETGSVELLRL